MMKHSIALAAVCLVVSFGIAAPASYEEGKVYRHQLDNGLVILTMERHTAPLIYHQLTYRVGSRNERLGITGISHVVEHMMFKGTPTYGKGKASRAITDNAGVFNAFTANDMTSYFEYLPANRIALAMEIEADRMQNAIFDPAEFTSELEVIKQERRMRTESSAQGVMAEAMNSVAYQSHPNRDPIIGWPADLSRMTREEAFTYYRTFYTPNNAFLVLVGDFATDEIVAMTKKFYGKIPRGPVVPEMWGVDQPQRVRKTFTLQHSDVASPSFRMAFHVPTYADTDAAPLRLAGMILCERSRDARLHKRLIEQAKIATGAAGGMGMTKDPGLFSISVGVAPDSSVERAEAMVWEEIGRMQREPVNERELQKVKNRYRFTQVTEYVKNPDIGSRLSRYEAFFGWDMFDVFDARIKAVTAPRIQDVMTKYFQRNQVTVGYLQPKAGGKKPVKRSTEEGEDPSDAPAPDPGWQEVWNYLNPPPAVRLDAPIPASDDFVRPKPIAPQVHRMQLDNGIPVYVIENHLTPAVFIGGLIETGNMPETNPGGKPGIGTLLADAMNRGTATRTYEELTERMAFLPFSFSVGGTSRSFSFQGYALKENAAEMMETGFDIMTQPGLREADIETLRRRHIISARDRFKKTGMAAFYHMFNALFADHPYSQTNSTEASIRSITREDLTELHAKYIRPDRTTLVVMGDMPAAVLCDLANKSFGAWKSQGEAPEVRTIPPVAELSGREITAFPEKDYTECTINIGFAPLNTVLPEEREGIAVLNSILASSALTSRIGIELRDKQGLIYGLKSEVWCPSGTIGYWKMNTKTGPKNVERVITGIFKEIRKLFAEGLRPEEIEASRNRQLGLLPMIVETPDDVATQVFSMLRDKQSLDMFDHKADRLKAVTGEDLMRIARKYLTVDRFRIVVDGPIDQATLDAIKAKL
jgi:zinc protease